MAHVLMERKPTAAIKIMNFIMFPLVFEAHGYCVALPTV
jgi:hypothetical protein